VILQINSINSGCRASYRAGASKRFTSAIVPIVEIFAHTIQTNILAIDVHTIGVYRLLFWSGEHPLFMHSVGLLLSTAMSISSRLATFWQNLHGRGSRPLWWAFSWLPVVQPVARNGPRPLEFYWLSANDKDVPSSVILWLFGAERRAFLAAIGTELRCRVGLS